MSGITRSPSGSGAPGVARGTLAGFEHRFEPAGSPDAPTLLLLHGTGGDENDLVPLGRLLHPRAALLSPRGQVLENGMPRYFRRFAEGVFDLEDLNRRTGYLANFIAAAGERYGLDPQGMIAAGFSNGANIAASLLLLRPGLLRAAILFSPMVPFELAPPYGGLESTDVFIGASRSDPVAPPAEAERLKAILERSGAHVRLEWSPGGHRIAPDSVKRAAEWLPSL